MRPALQHLDGMGGTSRVPRLSWHWARVKRPSRPPPCARQPHLLLPPTFGRLRPLAFRNSLQLCAGIARFLASTLSISSCLPLRSLLFSRTLLIANEVLTRRLPALFYGLAYRCPTLPNRASISQHLDTAFWPLACFRSGIFRRLLPRIRKRRRLLHN